MSIAYTYTTDGYFAGAIEDYGFLPNNATYQPTLADQTGYVQRWNGAAWEYVENHKGKSGYVDGKPFEVKEYGPLPAGWSETPPAPTDAEVASNVRSERNGLLSGTDYLMLSDAPITEEQHAAFVAYRQALRDVTAQPGFPGDVVWPTKPEL